MDHKRNTFWRVEVFFSKSVVPNLFLIVAHFDFENFPWPHPQTIAQELDPNFPAKSVLK